MAAGVYNLTPILLTAFNSPHNNCAHIDGVDGGVLWTPVSLQMNDINIIIAEAIVESLLLEWAYKEGVLPPPGYCTCKERWKKWQKFMTMNIQLLVEPWTGCQHLWK